MSLTTRLAEAFLDEHPVEAAQAIERLSLDERAEVLREAPEESAGALARMTGLAAAEALARLSAAEAAPLFAHLSTDTAIGLLRRLPGPDADRLLGGLPDERREALGRVLHYPEGTAGALMDPAVLALPDDISVAEARARLRRASRGLLHYLFVVDRDGRLVGVLDIPELMQARPREALRTVMRDRVEHLPAWAPAAAVRTHPGWRSYHAMPVTDDAGRLVGAIRYQTVRRLEQDVDTAQGGELTTQTVSALGELFHLGMAGMVEGVATAAAPRSRRISNDAGGSR